MMPVHVTGRGGLGDAIYQRPFIRELAKTRDVYLETSWPCVFSDLGIRPVKRGGLALQQHHAALQNVEWHEVPAGAEHVSLRYRWRHLKSGSIVRDMERVSGVSHRSVALDLPPLPASPIAGAYAVVRPPSQRLDYPQRGREPDPTYLGEASRILRNVGRRVVSLAAFVPDIELPDGKIHADLRFEHGELALPHALALVRDAAVVVSGPSWLVPACIATGTPLVVVGGGCGGRNGPQALVDRRHDARVHWIRPDAPCMCSSRKHGCEKTISQFGRRFAHAIEADVARVA